MDNQILITKIIDAPRERVFKAWTDPAEIIHWYHATEGWSTPHAESDSRTGGKFSIGFQSPDRKNDFDFVGVYNEVVEPERIVFTIADGRPVSVIFTEEGGKTRVDMTLTLESLNSAEKQREGWGAIIDNLGKYLTRV